MIRLIFTVQRETFRIEINNGEVWYLDRKLKKMTRLIPVDDTIQKRILLSRNKIPKHIVSMFNLTKEEQKEYDSCRNDEEIAEVCIKDCKKQGAILQKYEK